MWILIIPLILGLIILGLIFLFGGIWLGIIGVIVYLLTMKMISTIE